MATSAVPAAVDALLAILQAAPGLTGVRIVDGPPTNNLTASDCLFVGYQPGADSVVSIAQDFNAAGARTRDENFDVSGYIETRAGGSDMGARRRRCFEIAGELENALRATPAAPQAPTLNGAVLWAHLTTGDLFQIQSDGVLAGLAFTVRCRARI
ncbi:hypothetical protein AVW11_04040 [Streptomyces amritsarensis]|uniref:Uncharacterized protein n=1 Tax=Streptomyces amritsarensis TaxID=681158 RepID=A0ABX3G8V9_9ACTN|nr:hypothetical protein [Streptomyces amritsarensis]OLZ72571.1 hypothetical protein AVW11_04040 [Streptomyces amritsarensis]